MNSAGVLGDIRKSGSLYTKGRNRPGFETWVYRALPGEGVNAGAARCHFVSFEVIQSILLEILNRYAKKNTQQEFYAAICDFAQIFRKRQIIMRSDAKLPQPFASWSNSL